MHCFFLKAVGFFYHSFSAVALHFLPLTAVFYFLVCAACLHICSTCVVGDWIFRAGRPAKWTELADHSLETGESASGGLLPNAAV